MSGATAGRAAIVSNQRSTLGWSSSPLALPPVQPAPRKDRHVGDRIRARHVFRFAQPPVEHPIEAARLVGVAVVGVVDLLRRVGAKMVRLAQHRAEARHLPHQPLHDLEPGARLVGHEPPRLLRQIEQDRARFEDRDRLAVRPVVVRQRRDLVVRADREELGVELLSFFQVHPVLVVGKPGLFQHDVDLLAVGRCRGVEIDHRSLPAIVQGRRRKPQFFRAGNRPGERMAS